MNCSSFTKVAVGLTALVGALAVHATPILIDTLDLSRFPSFGDSNVQGGIQDAIASWNLANEPDLPTIGIAATPDVKLNSGDSVPGFPSFGKDTLSITLPMGDFNYVFFHWGGPNVDAAYKNPQLYYIGDELGEFTFTAPIYTEVIPAEYFTGGKNKGDLKKPEEIITHQYGLSFYSFYSEISDLPPPSGDPRPPTSVSDTGAATVALMGAGLLGVLGLRRLMVKS